MKNKTQTKSNFRLGQLENFSLRTLNLSPSQNNTPSRGSFQCGSHCSTCTYISNGLASYTFQSTGETRTITHLITTQLKKTYLRDPEPCHKEYIGETKRRLKNRFNERRRPVDKPTNVSKPTTVSKHFLTDHRTADDISFIPLELVHCNSVPVSVSHSL